MLTTNPDKTAISRTLAGGVQRSGCATTSPPDSSASADLRDRGNAGGIERPDKTLENRASRGAPSRTHGRVPGRGPILLGEKWRLAVVVTANNPIEPVIGGTVSFTAPSSGASAALSAGTATIGADGTAAIVAADNSIAGSYRVTALDAGAVPVSFHLTNLVSSLVSVYTVNSPGGAISGSGTSGTLPYVVFLANANANPGGNGAEIRFDSSVFASPQTITLGATLVLSQTIGPEVIDGPGAGLVTVSGGGTVGVFQIDSGVTATLSGVTITDGFTTGDGGGIDNDGSLDISDSSVTNNKATDSADYAGGGGIYNGGTLTISNSSITGNQQEGNTAGGGIYNDGTLTISDCSVANNQAPGGDSSAGGVVNFDVLTIDQSQFTGNTGAGLNQSYGSPMAVITNSTFSGNDGDGIDNNSNMSIVNCTIVDNLGQGIDTDTGGMEGSELLTIENCTIVGNTTDDLVNSTFIPVVNVAVGNTIFSTVVGVIESQGHNIITNSSGATGLVASDLLGVDPMLGPLQDNGGPTLTEAPLPGSPAIDAGDDSLIPAGVFTDQRGTDFPRIVNYTVDIGAVEVQGPWHFVVTAQPRRRHGRRRIWPDRQCSGQLGQRRHVVQRHGHRGAQQQSRQRDPGRHAHRHGPEWGVRVFRTDARPGSYRVYARHHRER